MLGGFLFWVIWELMKQAASFASAIAGGVYQKVSQFQTALPAAPATAATVAHKTAAIASSGASAARTMASAIRQSRVNKMIDR
jgi:hypothetical protein